MPAPRRPAQHELRFQRCQACGAWRHMPRESCAACGSFNWSWERSSGKGQVFSWTVMHRALHPGFTPDVPYATVVIELAEGVRMVSHVFGLAPEQISAINKQYKGLEAALSTSETENKILLTKIKKLDTELALYKDKDFFVSLPAGVKGKVLITDPKWNFVVLNVGEDQGVLEHGELLVNRAGRLVAQGASQVPTRAGNRRRGHRGRERGPRASFRRWRARLGVRIYQSKGRILRGIRRGGCRACRARAAAARPPARGGRRSHWLNGASGNCVG